MASAATLHQVRLGGGGSSDSLTLDLVTVGGDLTVSDQAKQGLRQQLGLNDPIPVQYVRWIGGMFHGDFGTSIRSGSPS